MDRDSLIGTQIDEYKILALLGEGGMARVYRGIDERLQRYAAIKVIDTSLQTDSDYTSRFLREARAIAQLEHPHIVRLYRYGEKEGLFYIAMQYIEGVDLHNILDSYRSTQDFMELQDILRITTQICNALDYIHENGVIHRDLKPSNIMLNKQGDAILTDFGLVLLTQLGTRGEILGSPTHVAPEQAISSAKATAQSDLYSLGVILYEMFTNRLPFWAEDPLDLAMMHISENPPPPRQLRPDLSPDIEAVILKALAKEPADRYPSGQALVKALEMAVTPTLQATQPTSLPRRSVLKYVENQVAEKPLPPIPVVVSPTKRSPRGQIGPVIKTTLPDWTARILKVGGLWVALGIVLCILLGTISLAALQRLRHDRQESQQTTAVKTISPLKTLQVDQENSVPSPTGITSLLPLPVSPTTTLVVLPMPLTSPTSTPTPVLYRLQVITYKDDSLVLVNLSEFPFPMAEIRLGDGIAAMEGSEWGLDFLDPGSCVIAIKNTGKPQLPDVSCEEAARLERNPEGRFWKEPFGIYYNNERIVVCDGKNPEGCEITVKGE